MTYQRIVVPLDGSLLSEYVFPQVERMATAFQSELTFLHIVPSGLEKSGVVQSGVVQSGEGAVREPTPSQMRAGADITRYLEDLQKQFELKGIRTHWTIRCGDPAEEIVWFVNEHQCDLVIMSTHGKGAPGAENMGSVAVDVLKHLHIPVVLVGVPAGVANL